MILMHETLGSVPSTQGKLKFKKGAMEKLCPALLGSLYADAEISHYLLYMMCDDYMPVKKKRPITLHMAWSLEKTKHSLGGNFIALNPF